MASTANNRYALFGDGDENAPPTISPTVEPSKISPVDQVADDSIPWQEVRKRGAPTTQMPLPPTSSGKALGVIDQTKFTIAFNSAATRVRTASASTADTTDKAYDPHENWCGVCSIKLPNKSAILTHIKQMPKHKHYCNLCKRVFKDRNGIQNHLENSLGHEVHCNLCLSAFNDEWGLKNHFENNYTVGHEFVCLTCLLGFRNESDLARHLQTAQKHTWCESCQRRFRNQAERDEHWQKTTKHKHCLQTGCYFDGPNQATLDEHLAADHFQCVGCKRIFESQTKLNRHSEACKSAIACPHCRHSYPGQAQLAVHLEHCFLCEECGYCTHHEGNYKIHMTKHASATIPCWACDAPMRTYSSLINHLESGRCSDFVDASKLLMCLGKWWYSPLFMDLDMHAHIRTGRINSDQLLQWMDEGSLHPFVCRAKNCLKTFGHMSSLVLHCESQACDWDIARLNMPGLEKELQQMFSRRSSATA